MKICFLTSYYPPFIDALCNKYNFFLDLSYQESLNLILDELYADTGSIYFYSKTYGNEASIIIQNFEILQKKWASENIGNIEENNWQEKIVLEQTKKMKPDVFYTESIQNHSSIFLDTIKKTVKLIVAWVSFPFNTLPNLNSVNLILTSTQHYKTKFIKSGLNAEYMLPAFDYRIIERLKDNHKSIPFSFIGGISDVHKNRWEALNYLCKTTDIKIWGYGLPNLPKNIFKRIIKKDTYSRIRKKHRGELWGLEMYQTLHDSLISFNIHEDLLKGNVGNMRMFEATGVATALLNDFGNNITSLFEPDKEIITYKTLPEAVEKLNYYLQNPIVTKEIGLNAQKRTLKEYNYTNYTIQMTDFIKKLI
ncbi:MAG: glycosyltransferase family 1 protein [Burkholderiales bacterium]|nr:glycosyltransferase family 1 protein [Bacteroidia bacterium]